MTIFKTETISFFNRIYLSSANRYEYHDTFFSNNDILYIFYSYMSKQPLKHRLRSSPEGRAVGKGVPFACERLEIGIIFKHFKTIRQSYNIKYSMYSKTNSNNPVTKFVISKKKKNENVA